MPLCRFVSSGQRLQIVVIYKYTPLKTMHEHVNKNLDSIIILQVDSSTEQQYTYNDVIQKVHRLHDVITGLKINKGDVSLLCLGNCSEYACFVSGSDLQENCGDCSEPGIYSVYVWDKEFSLVWKTPRHVYIGALHQDELNYLWEQNWNESVVVTEFKGPFY